MEENIDMMVVISIKKESKKSVKCIEIHSWIRFLNIKNLTYFIHVEFLFVGVFRERKIF